MLLMKLKVNITYQVFKFRKLGNYNLREFVFKFDEMHFNTVKTKFMVILRMFVLGG